VYSIGVDLGGTLTKVAVVASDGRILGHRQQASAHDRLPEVVFEDLRADLEVMARELGLLYPPPQGCGVGLPGVVDRASGWLRLSGPLAWEEIEIAAIASRALGCEVVVDNDVNAGALADLWFGEATGSSDTVYVAWGTGIGAAFVVSRTLYRSRGAAMGNFGHTPADPSSHRLCYCGCRGCLEVEAGGKAMVEQVRERLACGEFSVLASSSEPLTPERIAAAAAVGDPLARSVLNRSAVLMARALASVLAFLNPDTVVFGGGVSRCLPLIRNTFDDELRLRTPSFSLPFTRVVESRFGENAGVVGASLLPRNDVIR
jgi:glucokinase